MGRTHPDNPSTLKQDTSYHLKFMSPLSDVYYLQIMSSKHLYHTTMFLNSFKSYKTCINFECTSSNMWAHIGQDIAIRTTTSIFPKRLCTQLISPSMVVLCRPPLLESMNHVELIKAISYSKGEFCISNLLAVDY